MQAEEDACEVLENKRKRDIHRNRFTPEEDKQLYELVQQYGTAWDEIALIMGNGRSQRQLRERWQNYLQPKLDRKFTPMDDHALLGKFAEVGSHWAEIAALFPNKSPCYVKNRYRQLTVGMAKWQKPNSGLPHSNPDVIKDDEKDEQMDLLEDWDSSISSE
jgi:hypothetical protein